MNINSAAIIGTGAVGAVVGKQLSEILENKLFCVADSDRVLRYKQQCITINNEECHFNYVTPEELKPVDLIIISTKNLQLQEALDEIQKGVGENTVILSLLNGIQSEKEIAEVYGAEKILFGFIIDLQSINNRGQISCCGQGKIVFGENDNSKSSRIKAVARLFDMAGIKYEIPEDIHLAMWKKFLINTVFNSLGAICRSTYGGFRFDVLQDCARKIGHEVVQIAKAEGIALYDELIEEDIKMNMGYNPLGKCSMLQDMEAERNTENKWFCGTICQLGKCHGIPTPYCEFLGNLIEGTELARTLRN